MTYPWPEFFKKTPRHINKRGLETLPRLAVNIMTMWLPVHGDINSALLSLMPAACSNVI